MFPTPNIIVNASTLSAQGNSFLPLDAENPLQVEIRAGGVDRERVDALVNQLAKLVDVVTVGEAANQDYQGPTI